MGHNPATRDSKKADRKQALETRTPDEIIKGIRGNLAAHLAVTPSDTSFLLAQYDSVLSLFKMATFDNITATEAMDTLKAELKAAITQIAALQSQVDRFREVYEQENRNHTVLVSPEGVDQLKDEFVNGKRTYPILDDVGGEV